MNEKPQTIPAEGEAVLEAPVRRRDEWARAKDTEGVVCQTHVGGQALIEGIMMRGKFNWAVAVREPQGGIYLEEHDLASGRDKNSWLHKPIVRGCTALVESLLLSFKALDIASQHAFDLEEEEAPVTASEAQAERGSHEEDITPVTASEASDVVDTPVEDSTTEPDNPPSLRGTSEASDAATYAEDNTNHLTESEAPAPLDNPPSLRGMSEASDVAIYAEDESVGSLSQRIDSQSEESEEPPSSPAEPAIPKASTPAEPAIPKGVIAASMVVGVLLGIGIFIVLPAFVTNLIVGDYGEKTLLWNLIDGVLRIIIFIFYIWLIGRMKDIKRMFGYHGAEHKTIHCYEHGLPLTVENARIFPTLHVRCGTAFLLTTLIIAILVFTIVPIAPLIDLMGVTNGALRLTLVILSRIILLPIIAGLSYEVTVKWAGSHPENPLVQIVLWPGMQMQRLTTHQPDDSMLECAIAAMKCVLEREEKESATKASKA